MDGHHPLGYYFVDFTDDGKVGVFLNEKFIKSDNYAVKNWCKMTVFPALIDKRLKMI